ncbi:MAG: ABC transporter ATP-binding protein [Actinobacteria bacterium]|nr:ABC transporter ATP-binding protein [Actinomycetota bacterium]
MVENLTKSYGSLKALKGISFEAFRGEVFALIGPNGAGKTTSLRIISTILTPDDGDVYVANNSVRYKPEIVRSLITYLPEDAGAYKNMTGIGYLKFMASLYFDSKKDAREAVELGVEIAGLGDRLSSKIATYSKGMARKLLLARALMVRPVLAILDEPTSGLDVMNSIEVRKIIKNFARSGMTVLLSSHNMLEVEYLSDRVAIIDKGEILETGTPKELKDKYNASNLEEVFEVVSKN